MSSSLINSAADGSIGAALTAIGYLIVRRTRPGPDETAEAWRNQSEQLRAALTAETAQRIAYLEQTVAGLREENKSLVGERNEEIKRRDAEIRRLNTLLNLKKRPRDE